MSVMGKIRVLLADDHTLFRQGIKTLISAESDMEVVGEAPNGGEAVEKATETRPDLILMDIGMPGLSSFEATRQIRKNRPETKILFLTMYDDEDYLVEGMEVGASGYVLKDSPSQQLVAAMRDVVRGLPFSYQVGQPVATLRHPHRARARGAEDACRRELGERDRLRLEPQRQDRGSAQIQPDAQTGYPQQSAVGAIRHSEKDHQVAKPRLERGPVHTRRFPDSGHAKTELVGRRGQPAALSFCGAGDADRSIRLPGKPVKWGYEGLAARRTGQSRL